MQYFDVKTGVPTVSELLSQGRGHWFDPSTAHQKSIGYESSSSVVRKLYGKQLRALGPNLDPLQHGGIPHRRAAATTPLVSRCSWHTKSRPRRIRPNSVCPTFDRTPSSPVSDVTVLICRAGVSSHPGQAVLNAASLPFGMSAQLVIVRLSPEKPSRLYSSQRPLYD